jgi:Zn-dependent oligopeptidase
MKLYSETVPQTIEELDKKALDIANEMWVFKRDESYKMYASFWHIFGWGYAAGYYSYMWAELLEADVFEKIKEMWMFDRDTWEKFISTILGQGTRKDGWELFKDFMGRELSSGAFMKRKWLI